ncbi:MAG TPA: PIN domain-containing protein [Vineibacter sp.]|nr:PIN domain-containing protein [Vineibacter sp.]
MRAPSSTLVLDAAILVSAARGRSSGAILAAARTAALVTTDRVMHEARRRIELGLKRPELLDILDALAAEMTIVPVAALTPDLERSEATLRDAVASRNGSTRDAHVLALAWSVEADIWTTDRDFAGTGVATWSTPNLMRGLADAARDRV